MLNQGRIILLFILLLMMAGRALVAQPAQLSFRHFTTDDGLPSSQTYFTLEDKQGYLWVGTDNGIARYNGYEFEVFNSSQGLEDGVVFSIQETASGEIWVSTLSGRVYYFDQGEFHAYKFNDKLLELKQSRELMLLLDVLSTGELIIKVNYQGILRVENDGTITWLVKDKDEASINFYRAENHHSTFPRQFRYFVSGKKKRTLSGSPPVATIWNGKEFVPFVEGDADFQIDNIVAARHVVLDRMYEDKGVFIIGYNKLIHVFPNGDKYEFPFSGFGATHILPVNDQQYFFTATNGEGLLQVNLNYETQEVKVDTFLKGKSLSMITVDHKGGLWVTSLDDGVFYCPYPQQRIHVAENAGLQTRPTAIALADSVSFFACYANSELRLHNTVDNKQYKFIIKPRGIGGMADDLFFDHASGNLLVTNNIIFNAREVDKGKYEQQRYLNNGRPYSVFSAKEYLPTEDTLYWISSHNFGIIDPLTGEVESRMKLDMVSIDIHGLESFFPFPDGRRFIGTWFGLKEIKPGGKLVANDLGVEELQGRIERILSFGDGRIVIGTRSSGVVILSEDGHVVIDEEQHLASNQVRNLHVTEDGALWVATLQGMSKITTGPDGKYTVRTFDIGNGLIDNEVHDFDSWNNQLWIVSTAGIYKFLEPPLDTFSLPPTIKSVRVNGKVYPLAEDEALEPQQNYLSFDYSNILFSKGNTINYRYRINGEAWQKTREQRANYPNLPAGTYLFEVQSENEDGVWSKSSAVAFQINEYFLYTWKPWAIGFMLLFGALTTVFMIRERNRKREQNFLLEINRLEHAALHAQMNPHFVFNCLNSIQNFVLHNHTREAATYLSRFAKLIRKTLNSSLRGQHSLEQEKEMLDAYLELEKLRFKDVFNYEVDLDPSLPSESIFIPPLLIQPFVENAILHGMKDREEGGLIRVSISGTSKQLKVSITDNGIGYDPTVPTSDSSKGMLITTRRFAANAGTRKGKDHLSINPIVDSNGDVVGTIVALSIKPVPEQARTNTPALQT